MKLAIIDFNRTVYDPDSDSLIEGCREFLEVLRASNVRMVLLSRNEGSRADILERLGVAEFFSEKNFVDEKTAQVITDIIERAGVSPEATVVIGDYIYQDIRAGNQAGAQTIHFKRGKFADCEPKSSDDIPDHVVTDFSQALWYVL